MKANIWELKSSYGLDFMTRDTPVEELVSHIVFNKLPGFFKREMIRLSGSNYPSINFPIEHAIKTLECTRNTSVDRLKPTVCKANPLSRRNKTCLQNFYTSHREVFNCNLCNSNAHFPLSFYVPEAPNCGKQVKAVQSKKVVLFMCQSPVFEC